LSFENRNACAGVVDHLPESRVKWCKLGGRLQCAMQEILQKIELACILKRKARW